MADLYKKLSKYTLQNAINLEFKDEQFLALKHLYKNKKFSDDVFILLVLSNALVSYQLSWTWENYWWEFSQKAKTNFVNNNILDFFEFLLTKWKNNKRFTKTKLKRIKKFLNSDFSNFDKIKWEKFYKNMLDLAVKLGKIMEQPVNAKTIVFSVKMFSYACRNVFGYLEYFPYELNLPLDSRLKKIYEKNIGKSSEKQIKEFYLNLSKKLKIPPLHLDVILWTKFNDF